MDMRKLKKYSAITMLSFFILINSFVLGYVISTDNNISSNLQLEEVLLVQKQKTYDSFLLTLAIFLAAFMILVTVMLALGWVYNIYQLNSVKEDVRHYFKGDIEKITMGLLKSSGFEERLKWIEETQNSKGDIESKEKGGNMFD